MGIRTFTQKKNNLTVTLVESVTIHGGEICYTCEFCDKRLKNQP